MRPKDMLDLRGDLAAKVSNPTFRQGMAGIIVHGKTIIDHKNANQIVDYLPRTAATAENFFVIPEMSDLVQYASSVLDSTDVADVTLAPSRSGFAYFEKPLELIDIRQKRVLVHALMWDTSIDGSLVAHMWNDEYALPDDAALTKRKDIEEDLPVGLSISDKKWEDWMRVQGRWGYAGIVVYKDGSPIGDERLEVSEDLARQFEDVEGVSPEKFSNPHRLVHAFWLLLSQTLTAREVERGDRKMARRMKQMGVPNEVTVITFRRVDYDPKMEGAAKVEWNHRWLVRGYWRWQPYKNEEGDWARKRIWINPHVKGPVDKPLVITQKINAFVR
jgi:hypothetical protein